MILAHNKSYIGKIRHRSTRKKSDSTSSSSLLNAAEPWNGKSGNFNSKETFYLTKSCFFERILENDEKSYLYKKILCKQMMVEIIPSKDSIKEIFEFY